MDKIIEKYSVVGNAIQGGFDVEIRTKFPVQDFKIVEPSRRGNLIISCKYNDQEFTETLNINGNFHISDYDIKPFIDDKIITIDIRPKVVDNGARQGFLPELGLFYDEVGTI